MKVQVGAITQTLQVLSSAPAEMKETLAALENEVAGLSSRWSAQMNNFHGILAQAQGALNAATTAFEQTERAVEQGW